MCKNIFKIIPLKIIIFYYFTYVIYIINNNLISKFFIYFNLQVPGAYSNNKSVKVCDFYEGQSVMQCKKFRYIYTKYRQIVEMSSRFSEYYSQGFQTASVDPPI